MGGGDLNLKKSWHPHTMKNQEKVWKAEQAKSQEERKLNDLRKEIAEERTREELKRIGEGCGILTKTDGDKKLEWMYKNNSELINRDEYLLGRTIDKSFETLQAEEQRKDQSMVGVKQSANHVEHEVIPFSIRAYRNMESTEQVDLQRKVMEDPLMLIKQREMESRRKILENPVKLKELHRILKTDQVLKKSKKSKKMKSKKSKKRCKKHGKSSTDSSSSDSDSNEKLDKELAKRYKRLKGSLIDTEVELADINLSKLLDTKYETISKELDKAVESKKKLRKRHKQSDCEERDYNRINTVKRNKRSDRSHSPEIKNNSKRRDDHSHRQRDGHYRRTKRSRSRSTERNQRQACRRREDKYRATMRSRSPKEHYKRRCTRSKSCTPVQSTHKSLLAGGQTKKGLSESEKEARRREMMENAAWRETDRTRSVQKHREAYAREEEQHKTRDFDKDFINKEVKKAIENQTSVGSRIRSNLNNIQRTSAAMNAKFTKK